MRVLVFGLGALGHVFATFLQKGGHDVVGIGRRPVIEKINEEGIEVSGIWGNFKVKLKGAYERISEIPRPDFDYVFLTVKSYDTKAAVEDIKSVIQQTTVVICAQNGYGNYETAVKVLGNKHVALARVIFGAELLRPGEVKVTVCAGDIIIGAPRGTIPENRLSQIVDCLNQVGLPAKQSNKIFSYLWDKILYNCALNPLAALLEVNYGTLGDIPETRELMKAIVEEVFSVAQNQNIPLFWKSASEYLRHFYDNLLPPTREHYPSMLQDIQKGKRTEIDALNGAIVNLAKEANITTPVNAVITKLIKAKEQICKRRKRNSF